MEVKDFAKRYRILLALLALLAALMALGITEYRYGIPAQAKMDAYRDYKHRKFYMQSTGLAMGCSRSYNQLLRERYNVIRINRGCVTTAEDAIYEDNYNEQLGSLINKFYSKDVFEECFNEACVNKKTGKLWQN